MTSTQSEFDKIFDLCLERLQRGGESLSAILGDYPEWADELRPLLEASAWLIENKSVLDPRPSFVVASRKSLMTHIQAEGAHGGTSVQELTNKSFLARFWNRLTSPERTRVQRLTFQLAFAMVIVFVLLIGGSGLSSLAQGTQPGDSLYPVKIAFEQLELAFTFDAQTDISLHVEFAQLRTEEMQSLVNTGQFTYLRDVLANYRYHMDETLRLLADLVEDDPAVARTVALETHQIVFEGPHVLSDLAYTVPEQIFSGFGTALDESLAWVELMMGILDELEVEIEPQPTPGEVRVPTRTMVPTTTPPPRETASIGAVSTPTTAPSPTMSASPTSTSTQTPTSPSGWIPTSTSTQQPDPPSASNTPVFTLTSTVTFSPTPTTKISSPTATNPPATETSTATSPPPTASATSPPPPTPTATTPPPPPTSTPTDPPYPR